MEKEIKVMFQMQQFGLVEVVLQLQVIVQVFLVVQEILLVQM